MDWAEYNAKNKKDQPDAAKQATEGAQNRKVSGVNDILSQMKSAWTQMTTNSDDKPREDK